MNKTDLKNHSTCITNFAHFEFMQREQKKLLRQAEKDIIRLVKRYGVNVDYLEQDKPTKGIYFEKPIYLPNGNKGGRYLDCIFITIPIGMEAARAYLRNDCASNEWYDIEKCANVMARVFAEIDNVIKKQTK